ncbi:MAG TPA: ribosome recycling factor [Acholeplasma sp.]|jgi:ribosome recycling factor|nr:ribosome recycling factor [Acholeplasma sp.]
MEERVAELFVELEMRMEEAVKQTEREFSKIRTGRANPALLDVVTVEYYGVATPLNQIANITIPEGNQLYIKPYDKGILKEIERSISAANIGLNPQNDGVGIRLILPALTEERRKNLSKEVDKLVESGKVLIRNIRREGNEMLKALELREDAEYANLDEIQELTNKYVEKVDESGKKKIEEITAI